MHWQCLLQTVRGHPKSWAHVGPRTLLRAATRARSNASRGGDGHGIRPPFHPHMVRVAVVNGARGCQRVATGNPTGTDPIPAPPLAPPRSSSAVKVALSSVSSPLPSAAKPSSLPIASRSWTAAISVAATTRCVTNATRHRGQLVVIRRTHDAHIHTWRHDGVLVAAVNSPDARSCEAVQTKYAWNNGETLGWASGGSRESRRPPEPGHSP